MNRNDEPRCVHTFRVESGLSVAVRCSKRPHSLGLHVGLVPEGVKDSRGAAIQAAPDRATGSRTVFIFFTKERRASEEEIIAEWEGLKGEGSPCVGTKAPYGMQAMASTASAPAARPSGKRSASAVVQAMSQGYSGDTCHKCQSLKVIRTGTCGTCQDCGESTSCG
jgi:hypothetical protein